MNILALETSGDPCSVGLLSAGTLRVQKEEGGQRSRNVLLMLDSLLAEASLAPASLDLLAWSAGPGSFTGLRMGASICQAIAYVHRLPVVSLSSLQVYAQAVVDQCPAGNEQKIGIAVDARMGEIYWASFSCQDGTVSYLEQDQVMPASASMLSAKTNDGQRWLLAGDGWALPGLALENHAWVDVSGHLAKALVALAARVSSTEWSLNPLDCNPRYLRGATQWKKRERLPASV